MSNAWDQLTGKEGNVYPFGDVLTKDNTHQCTLCGTVYLATLHYCPHCPSNSTEFRGRKKNKSKNELFVRMPKKGGK
jgi:hypothetical protein